MKFVMSLALALALGSCNGPQIHKFKVANADLSAALARTATTVIQLQQAGSMTPDEGKAILPRISDATVLSDKMEQCANAVSASKTIVGCVTPLLSAVRDDINAASLGLKSPGAVATFTSALNVAISATQEIAKLGGN